MMGDLASGKQDKQWNCDALTTDNLGNKPSRHRVHDGSHDWSLQHFAKPNYFRHLESEDYVDGNLEGDDEMEEEHVIQEVGECSTKAPDEAFSLVKDGGKIFPQRNQGMSTPNAI